MSVRVHVCVLSRVVLCTLLVGCGSTKEPTPVQEPEPALIEELSYDLPAVDLEAGTLTWTTGTANTVIVISNVTYLEHRQAASGHFILEAVLVDGERHVIIEGAQPQKEHAVSYAKQMQKDLVERYPFE